MESATLLALALAGAVGMIVLFAIIRSTMSSPSTPSWIASEPLAYVFALALTGGFSASIAFLGYVLSAIVPSSLGILATFAIHGGLLAALIYWMPGARAEEASRSYGQSVSAAS
jgi:hypothetical protein